MLFDAAAGSKRNSFILNTMLKSCPSCSYIGNDGEHICPFCKADLAVGRPRRTAVPLPLRSFGGRRMSSPGLVACFRSKNAEQMPILGKVDQ